MAPHDRRSNATRRRLLAGLGVALAGGVAGCGGGGGGNGDGGDGSAGGGTTATTRADGDDPTSTATPTETETVAPTETATSTAGQTDFVVGEPVTGDRISMVVRSVERTRSIGEFQEADEGNTFAVVRLVVKNTAQSESVDFSSILQTRLKDSQGYTYDPSLSGSESAFEGGQLVPGEVARGDVAFEIPQDATGLVLQFDFSAVSTLDRVTVDLTEQASRIADLQQSLRVDVRDVGETVTSEGVAVTVNGVEYESSLGESTEAEEGREFAVVDLTTANESTESVTVSSLLQMEVKDGTGRAYAPSPSATGQLSRGYSGGEIAAGDRIRGKLAFEVPADAGRLYFTFVYSIITDGSKAFWRLR